MMTERPNDTLWPRLQRLLLDVNQVAQLPRWLSLCKSLSYLNLSNNPLQTIPVLTNSWPALVELVADECDFGPLGLLHLWHDTTVAQSPEQSLNALYARINAFPLLQSLSTARSGLRDLPADAGCMTSLVVWDASGNNVSRLPESLQRLTRLETLVLTSNVRGWCEVTGGGFACHRCVTFFGLGRACTNCRPRWVAFSSLSASTFATTG